MADSTASKNTATGHTDHWKAQATKSGTYEFKTGGTYVDRNIDFVVPASTTQATNGTASATAGTTSVTGMETTTTNTGFSVTATGGSASTTAASLTASVGFVDSAVSATSPAKSATGETSTKYIKASTTSKTNGTATATAGTVSTSGIEIVTENTGYSVTATGGSASTTAASVTASTGYVGTAVNASTEAKSATGASETKYIKKSEVIYNKVPGSQNVATNTVDNPNTEPNEPGYGNEGIDKGEAYLLTSFVPSTSFKEVVFDSGYCDKKRLITVSPMSSGTQASLSGSNTTVNSTSKVATRGVYKNDTAGYLSTGTKLAAATFGNSATADTTYVDISDALVSAGGSYVVPIIPENGYLYINKGYVDNLKISLAHLVPDTIDSTNGFATADKMLQGYALFDKDGKAVTGTIVTKTASDLSASGKTVTVPAGYYASQVTKDVASGSYTLNGGTGSTNNSISELTSESISGATRLTSKFSSTAPTSGYYVAIQAPKKTVNVTPTATITSGYIANGTAATSTTNGTATVNASGKYYVSIGGGSVTNNTSGGTSSGTINAGSQIKIGAGYYPNDVYYTAQSADATTAAAYNVSGAASGFTAASSATSYYVTPSTTVTTAGYLAGDAGKSGSKVYIPTTTITGNVAATSSSSTYTAPTLASTAPSGAYLTLVGKGTGAGTGMVSTSTVGSMTRYIPIYEGSYSVS